MTRVIVKYTVRVTNARQWSIFIYLLNLSLHQTLLCGRWIADFVGRRSDQPFSFFKTRLVQGRISQEVESGVQGVQQQTSDRDLRVYYTKFQAEIKAISEYALKELRKKLISQLLDRQAPLERLTPPSPYHTDWYGNFTTNPALFPVLTQGLWGGNPSTGG